MLNFLHITSTLAVIVLVGLRSSCFAKDQQSAASSSAGVDLISQKLEFISSLNGKTPFV